MVTINLDTNRHTKFINLFFKNGYHWNRFYFYNSINKDSENCEMIPRISTMETIGRVFSIFISSIQLPFFILKLNLSIKV